MAARVSARTTAGACTEMAWLGNLSVVLTGLLFVLAGLSKVLNPQRWVEALRGYDFLPRPAVPYIALGLPPVEILLGIAMFYDGHGWLVPCIGAGLLMAFACAMMRMLRRGRKNIPCGCGVLGGGAVSWSLVFRNVILAGVAFGGIPGGAKITAGAVVAGALGIGLTAKLDSSMAATATLAVKAK